MARRTKAEAEATREALLDAAEKVFFEQGVTRTSLEQIARHAGLTRGAVYWHFEGKADLLQGLLDRVRMPFEELLDEIDPSILTSSPLDTLRQVCHQGLTRLERPRVSRVHAILLHRCEYLGDIDPQEIQNRLTHQCYDEIHEQFLKAQTQGLLNPTLSPEIATRLLQSLLGGIFHDWLREPERFSLSAEGGALVDTLFQLLSRDEQPQRNLSRVRSTALR